MAAGPTFEPIATTTLGAAAATIDFTSIPATYTDLRLVIVCTANTGSIAPKIRMNSLSTNIYSGTTLLGNGSAASSGGYTNDDKWGVSTLVASTPTLIEVDIFSYAGSTFKTNLTKVSKDENGSGVVLPSVNLCRSTAAITSLTILESIGNNYAAGTTATLYGILKA
jgi:hypothetical protein